MQGYGAGQTNYNPKTTPTFTRGLFDFDMASRPRRATAAVISYDEDILASNSTRKRNVVEPPEPRNTTIPFKKRAPKTANAGSLEWILTSNKSPLTSLPLDVNVDGMTLSIQGSLNQSYSE